MKDKHSHADPNDGSSGEQKRNVTGKMHVQGEVEIHLPPGVQQQNATADKKRETRETIKQCVEGITLLFVVVVAGFSGCQTRYARISSDAALQANNLNRDALESVQRGFIIFDSVSFTQGVEFNKARTSTPDIIFRSQWENTGSTPAKGISQCFRGEHLQMEPDEDQFANQCALGAAEIVGPKKSFGIGMVRKRLHEIVPDTPETKSFEMGGQGDYFWGWFTYRDVFAKTDIHLTEFCQQVGLLGAPLNKAGAPNPAGGGMQIGFQGCTRHNCADKDCEDYERIIKLRP